MHNVQFLTQCGELFLAPFNSTTRKTVYITVEARLSESWLTGSPIILFELAFFVNLSQILHN